MEKPKPSQEPVWASENLSQRVSQMLLALCEGLDYQACFLAIGKILFPNYSSNHLGHGRRTGVSPVHLVGWGRVYKYMSLCRKYLWRTRPYKPPANIRNKQRPHTQAGISFSTATKE